MNPSGGPKIEVKMTDSPSRGRHMTRDWTDAGIVDFDPIEWKALLYCSSLKDFKTVMYGAVPSLFSIILLCKFIPGFSMSMAFFVSGIHCAVLIFMGLMSGALSKGLVFLDPRCSYPHLSRQGYLLIRRNVRRCRCQATCTRCNGDVNCGEWDRTANGVIFGRSRSFGVCAHCMGLILERMNLDLREQWCSI